MSRNVRKKLLNSSLEVSQSVSAATIQGMHEKCSNFKFMTFQINDNYDRKMISFKQISITPINLLVRLVNFPVALNFTLPFR